MSNLDSDAEMRTKAKKHILQEIYKNYRDK